MDIFSRNPVFAYYHTHWDREWYLPFRMYQYRLTQVIDTLLETVESGQIPCFTLDGQTILMDDYLALRPQAQGRLQALIQSDRVSIGPWYVMPDCFLVSGESLIRNLQLGMADAETWGETTFTGYLPDTFGHPQDLPMILTQLGLQSAIVWRGIKPQQPFFNWQSPSGDSVLTLHLTQGYFQHIFHMGTGPEDEKQAFESWHKAVLETATPRMPLLFPVGADHLGIVPDAPKRLAAICPTAQAITPDRFMQNAQAIVHPEALPTVEGELNRPDAAYVLPGVFSSRMYLKQQNRVLEWRLTRQLEPLLALGELLGCGMAYTGELDLLWRTLLQNHPHDSICGCSVDAVHQENEVRFAHVDQLSAMMLADLHHRLKQTLTPNREAALVLNLSDQAYTGVVPLVGDFPSDSEPTPSSDSSQTISSDVCLDQTFMYTPNVLPLAENQTRRQTRLVWAEDIPAHSAVTLPSGALDTPDPILTTANSLENNQLRAEVLEDGTLWVWDKKTGQQISGLHQVVRRDQQGDSYNAAPLVGSEWEFATLQTVTIEESGPLRGVLALNYYFAQGGFWVNTQVFLTSGSPCLDFETTFVNEVPDQIVQVAFSSSKPITQVTAEGHFTPVIRSIDPQYRLEDAMPAAPQTELKVQSGAIQRFVQWQNQTLITQGLAEYTVEGHTLGLTLLRAFGMLSRNDTGVRGSHAGPPLATPQGQCLDRTVGGCYRWAPGLSYTEAMIQSDLFFGAVYGFDSAHNPAPHPTEAAQVKTWLTVSNPWVATSACMPCEEGLRVRLVNPTSDPQPVTLSIPGLQTTITLEDLRHVPLTQTNESTLTLAPMRVQTVRIRVQ